MPRPLITGIHLKNVRGWRLSTGESHLAPGLLIVPFSLNTDDLGLITGASLDYRNRPAWQPYGVAIRFDILDALEGWVPILAGRVVNKRGLSRWTLELGPVEDIEADAFYRGQVPPSGAAWGAAYNLTGKAAPSEREKYLSTNQGVMSDLVRDLPASTWGVDAEGRAVLGPSSAGVAVQVPRLLLRNLSCTGYELNNYLSEWRCDPGKGWRTFEGYSGVVRPTYAPKKGGEAKAVFKEVTEAQGAPLKFFGVLRTEPTYPELGDPPVPDPLPPDWEEPGPARELPLSSGGVEVWTHIGTSKALYMVWDFQTWYRESALVETNASDYEPLEAYLKFGLRLDEFAPTSGSSYLEPEIVVSEAVWLSSSAAPDLEAVQQWFGGFEEAAPKSLTGQFAALAEDYDRSIPVPQRSSRTLETIRKPAPIRLRFADVGKVTYVDYKIDPKLFREDLSVAGENGTRQAYGRHYLHIALAWGIELEKLEQAQAKVTFLAQTLEFKRKQLLDPDLSELAARLNAPTLTGPIWEADVDGVVLPPAELVTPDGPQRVAGAQISLTHNGATTRVRTQSLPYVGATERQAQSERRR